MGCSKPSRPMPVIKKSALIIGSCPFLTPNVIRKLIQAKFAITLITFRPSEEFRVQEVVNKVVLKRNDFTSIEKAIADHNVIISLVGCSQEEGQQNLRQFAARIINAMQKFHTKNILLVQQKYQTLNQSLPQYVCGLLFDNRSDDLKAVYQSIKSYRGSANFLLLRVPILTKAQVQGQVFMVQDSQPQSKKFKPKGNSVKISNLLAFKLQNITERNKVFDAGHF